MSPFLAELLGTALLILLGNGVVASVGWANANGVTAPWQTFTCVAHVSGRLSSTLHLGMVALGWLFDRSRLPKAGASRP